MYAKEKEFSVSLFSSNLAVPPLFPERGLSAWQRASEGFLSKGEVGPSYEDSDGFGEYQSEY